LFNNVQEGFNMFDEILRLHAAMAKSGYRRSTLYARIGQGLWTAPVKLGPRCVGWPANEISALNAANISAKSDIEIRCLVQKLMAARKHAV
jgi:prophage regulatory protein